MVQVILHQTVALVRAVMERTVPALLCMFMFTARLLKRAAAAACIQLLSLFAEQMNGVFTCAVFCLY